MDSNTSATIRAGLKEVMDAVSEARRFPETTPPALRLLLDAIPSLVVAVEALADDVRSRTRSI